MSRRARVWWGTLLLAWSAATLAAAAPDGGVLKPRKPSKAELQRYRATMAEAVKAAKKGNHAGAMAAYDRALAIKPNDQAALTDQGWSALQLHQLDRAEAIIRRALENHETDSRTAAAYYNLGRILEARGNRAAAIEAYQESLDSRPTRTVREHLATLDPAAAAASDPLKPTPMLGPFARLADFCQTNEEFQQTDCPIPGRGNRLENFGSPYHDIVWFEVGNDPSCFMAFRLEAGWFVSPKGWDCMGSPEAQIELDSFALVDLVPGGAHEVEARTSTTALELYAVNDGFIRSSPNGCESRLLACGVPMKNGVQVGTPTCIDMPTGSGPSYCGASEGWTWQLQPVFSAAGQIDVKASGKPDDTARALIGRRRLAFP